MVSTFLLHRFVAFRLASRTIFGIEGLDIFICHLLCTILQQHIPSEAQVLLRWVSAWHCLLQYCHCWCCRSVLMTWCIGLAYLVFCIVYTKRPMVGDAHAKLEKSSNFQIYPWGGKSDPLPHLKLPEDRVNSSLFNDIGLSFLFTEMKELCEARAKLEMSSNFQIYPWG